MLLHKGILPKKPYVYLDLSQLVSKWHGRFLIWSNPSFFLTDLRTTLFNLRVKKYFLSNFISNIFNTRKLPVGSVPPACWPCPEVSHVSEGMGAPTSWMGTHPSPLWTDTHLWKHYLPAISFVSCLSSTTSTKVLTYFWHSHLFQDQRCFSNKNLLFHNLLDHIYLKLKVTRKSNWISYLLREIDEI